MDETPSAPVTRLLLDWGRGDARARDRLLPEVYGELRRVAASYLSRERRGHTLQPTALVHEAYLRLIDQRQVDWKNRAQFVGLAAVMMRRVLVNHARDRLAAKRGGNLQKISISMADTPADGPGVDVLALHEALERLAALDQRKCDIVELKFFGGMTTKEIGEALGVSAATIEREWTFARAWLFDAVGRDPA